MGRFLPVKKTVIDIEFRGRWSYSHARARLLLHHNVGFGVAILATDYGMEALWDGYELLCDATFKACPFRFCQVYVIVGSRENRFSTVVLSFLPGNLFLALWKTVPNPL